MGRFNITFLDGTVEEIPIHDVKVLTPNTTYELSKDNTLITGPVPSDGKYNGDIVFNIRNITEGGKKPTKKRVVVKGKPKVVYKGPRGGEYIKQNGGFVSLKTL